MIYTTPLAVDCYVYYAPIVTCYERKTEESKKSKTYKNIVLSNRRNTDGTRIQRRNILLSDTR